MAAVAFMNLAQLNEIFSILAGGIAGAIFLYFSESRNKFHSFSPLVLAVIPASSSLIQSLSKTEFSLQKLFITFQKIGSVWFGSGYILMAYFEGNFYRD